jgi:hypothetical protein
MYERYNCLIQGCLAIVTKVPEAAVRSRSTKIQTYPAHRVYARIMYIM